ncbi:hypothetical protein L5515_000835 [Caenorhabditis briggsae]|nr:hypothetical protein L3Y34_014760 [Caenorhabditis briggsae]UMM11657.1 hypothetical protein L5515_000835 [Caenorhabditis briggsae]
MLLFYIILLIGAASAAKPKYGNCLEGDKIRHEVDAEKYYQCVRNKWVLLECQINYYFNVVTGFCEFYRVTPMPPTPPPMRVCRPGSRKPDVFDNTRYLECTYDGKGFIVRYCQPGAIFVSSENMCVNIRPTYTPPTLPTYTPPTPATPYYGACKESAGRDGYKPDIFNCRKFYKCASGLWTQMSCGQGTIWNQAILTCDHDRGQCSYPPVTTTYPTTWHSTTWWPTTRYPTNPFKK